VAVKTVSDFDVVEEGAGETSPTTMPVRSSTMPVGDL
jgi:hypothetical protein